MFFSVRELEIRKAPFSVELQPGKIDFVEGLRQLTPICADGAAELASSSLGEIRVRGKFAVRMAADCDRCLAPAEYPIDERFDLSYWPTTPGRPGEERHLDEDEADIGFYEGKGLDLEDVLRERIILALPMQRVCRADCKGFCPVCGQNRNLADCGCREKAADDRWAALKQIDNEK